MAAPMRSTDFRSIVEPILNECFDGVYDQRTDEWSRVFREQEGIPRNYHEEPVLYGFGAAPQLNTCYLSARWCTLPQALCIQRLWLSLCVDQSAS